MPPAPQPKQVKIRDVLHAMLSHSEGRRKLFRHNRGRTMLLSVLESDPTIGTELIDAKRTGAKAMPDSVREALRKTFDATEERMRANGREVLLSLVEGVEFILLDTPVGDLLYDLVLSLLGV